MRHEDAMRPLLALALFLGYTAIAQDSAFAADRKGFDVGGAVTIADPRGEFGDNVTREGYGGTVHGLYKLGKSPFHAGLQAGFIQYGNVTSNQPWSTTIPDVYVDVTSSNNIVLGHVLVRAQQDLGNAALYLDGLFGFTHLYTETSVKDEDDWEGEPIASSTNFSDTTLSYGGGGGVQILVYRDRSSTPFAVYVDLGAQFLRGGKAEYLKKGLVKNADGSYNTSRSRTDLLLYRIGASVRF